MPSMWCCYSQRSASPLPNNRPVDLPRPAATRTPFLQRFTTRKASQGSETRNASKDSGTSQIPNLIDVPQPGGRRSRILTRLTTRNAFRASGNLRATRQASGTSASIDTPPICTSPTPNLIEVIQPIERWSRIFTRFTTRNASKPTKASRTDQAEGPPVKTSASPPPPPPPSPPATSPPPPTPAAPAPHTPPTSSTQSVGVAPMTLSGDLPPPRRSLDSVWARYPSHDRQGRSLSPAGGREGVAVRDFAPVVVGPPARAVKKARSTDDLLRGWVRRYERQMAKPPGGHRSSIAPGGFVEYPELELVAPATPFAAAPAATTTAAAAPPAAGEEDQSGSPSAPAPQPDLRAPSSEGLAAQFPNCAEDGLLEDGEADLARGLHFAELVALRREVNAILAEEMALGLYEGDFY